MKDEILFICMGCRKEYVGTEMDCGLSCPNCGETISPLASIKELEERVIELENKISSARKSRRLR